MANAEYAPAIEFRPFEIASISDVEMVDKWSAQSGDMIPVDEETIRKHHHIATGAYIFGELAAYGAISVVYSKDVIEFGGLVVNPDLRRHKIGTAMVKHVVAKANEEINPELILAFGNPKSSGLFKKLGGRVVDDATTLPSEVWKLCHICPKREQARAVGKNCCERVFDITHIKTD